MKAARLVGPRRFEFLDVEMPRIQQGEALVKMEYLSVCGSDLRTYDRTLPEEQYPLRIGAPCHECAGIVVESNVADLKVGQRVIAVTNVPGLVEYATVTPEAVVPIPENGMDPAQWVLCQPTGTVLYAVNRMHGIIGKRIVVLGQGAIGLAFTDFLSRGGAGQVIVTDLLDYRLDMARKIGATHTINAARDDVVAAVTEITGGAMADFVVECAGRPESTHQAFEVLRRLGTAVIFGMTHTEDEFEFNWNMMYSKLPTIIVTNSAAAGERVECVRSAVDLVAQGRMDFSYMLTHRLPFSDVSRAYEIYSNKEDNSIKLVMSL